MVLRGDRVSVAGNSVRGVTRSLFNYLVPMLQDKRAEEEKEEGAPGLATQPEEKG
jgi:hypothetical protein